MSGAHDFVAALARAGKGYKEIKEMVDAVFGDKTLHKTAIYEIIKKVKAGKDTADQQHLNPKKTVWTAALIASEAATVEEDQRVTIETLATAHGASLHTIHRILREDLGLEKKTARWVPRLLSPEQKEE
jgi:histone-lysine N-methyltransferase SETMAR